MGLLRQDLPSSMLQVTETCMVQQGGRVPVGNGHLLAQYDLGRAPHPSGLSPLLSSGHPDCCEGGSVGSRNPPDTAFSKCLKWKLRWQHQGSLWSVAEPGDLFPGSQPQERNVAVWAAAVSAPTPGTLWAALEGGTGFWMIGRWPQVNLCLLSQHKHLWAPLLTLKDLGLDNKLYGRGTESSFSVNRVLKDE